MLVLTPLLKGSVRMQVCLVGSRYFNTFGSHGSAEYIRYSFFPSLQDCCRCLKDERGTVPAGRWLPAPQQACAGTERACMQDAECWEWRLLPVRSPSTPIPSPAPQLSCWAMRSAAASAYARCFCLTHGSV